MTRDRELAATYLDRLVREVELQGALYDRRRRVTQLHWGGGTPTYFSEAQMRRLMTATDCCFTRAEGDAAEFGIELDPREVRPETLATLRVLGFNRVSLGVQDFDPAVQKAVNRIQSVAQTEHVVDEARALGFRSVSVDLIYGLPFQTPATVAATIAKVVTLAPDRISIYNYAHLPDRFPPQRRLDPASMPSPAAKLDLLQLCIDRFGEAGYAYIGMDHFALPTDDLAKAQRDGALYRNFQGYSTHADCDLVGLGMSAIGTVGGSFFQNTKTLDAYGAALDAGRLPTERGLVPDAEDRLRRAIIMQLICRFELDFADFDVDFAAAFAPELRRLEAMAHDGLLTIDGAGIRVTDKGRFLIRNVCMVFDRYLGANRDRPRFSRAI